MAEISERELLVELGLASLDRENGGRAVALFLELLELRVARRLSHLVSSSGMDAFEAAADTDPRAFMVLKESVPEYGQYVSDELQRTKADFVSRLTLRVADDVSGQQEQKQNQ